MNIEQPKQTETDFPQNHLKDFMTKVFLEPYINGPCDFLSPEDQDYARGAVPELIDTFMAGCRKIGLRKIIVGGTSMEAFSEQEAYGSAKKYVEAYWGIRKKFTNLDREVINSLSSRIRGDISKQALISLGEEGPDLDASGDHAEQQVLLHRALTVLDQPRGASLSFGPISPTNKIIRLCSQLISPHSGRKIFHIDHTTAPSTGDEVASNRRINTTDYQRKVSHEINLYTGEILPKPITNLDAPVSLDIAGRDPASVIEIVLRQIRKTSIRRLAHQQESSITDLSDIFDQNTVFDIIALTSDPANKDIYDRQSPIQQKMWLMEFYTILMSDLQSVDTLFQLKLLPLILGQDLSRKQVLTLMSSSSFTFNSPNPQLSARTRNRSVTEIDESIANFRKLPLESNIRNGLTAFSKSFEKINNAEAVAANNSIRPKILRHIYDSLIQWGGGMTTTMLHRVLSENEQIPPLTKEGKQDFSRLVINLIASGHIEVVTRNLNGEPVRFLYPITRSQPIPESNSFPFSTAESVFGLRVDDGKLFPAVVRAHFDNLDHLQRLLRQHQLRKADENPWFDPRIDS